MVDSSLDGISFWFKSVLHLAEVLGPGPLIRTCAHPRRPDAARRAGESHVGDVVRHFDPLSHRRLWIRISNLRIPRFGRL